MVCGISRLHATQRVHPSKKNHQETHHDLKPIQLIAQQPPGSGSDAMTRVWADCAARELGQPVVVQNKPGANGILAVNYLKAQPADGYNLLSIGMSQMTITPYVYKQQPYDPLRDFDGVAVLGTSPLVLAVPAGQGIASLADLQKLARATPGGINFGSPGKGSPAHLLTSALVEKLGVPGTHVPFVGEGAGLTALMGQQIHAMTLVIGTAAAQVKAGAVWCAALTLASRCAHHRRGPARRQRPGAARVDCRGSQGRHAARAAEPAQCRHREMPGRRCAVQVPPRSHERHAHRYRTGRCAHLGGTRCRRVAPTDRQAGTGHRMTVGTAEPLVTLTHGGQLRGLWEEGVCVFRGMPYAQAPRGALRFAAPVPASPWSGVRDATAFAPMAPQLARAARADAPMLGGDDCLAVNVWAPPAEPGAHLPVMV